MVAVTLIPRRRYDTLAPEQSAITAIPAGTTRLDITVNSNEWNDASLSLVVEIEALDANDQQIVDSNGNPAYLARERWQADARNRGGGLPNITLHRSIWPPKFRVHMVLEHAQGLEGGLSVGLNGDIS